MGELRTVRRRDLRALRRFATTAIVYVDDGTDRDVEDCADEGVTAGAGARLAEDDSGILGSARTRFRCRADGIHAELTSVLIARRAREWAVDLLLVDDARCEAAARGVTLMSVLVRPPVDVFFRALGAQPRTIVGSWSGAADPRIQLDLTCPR